jgi:hypothetical protein
MNRTAAAQAILLRTGFWLAATVLTLLLASMLAAPVLAGTFGTDVPIAGEASAIALDEPRGLLYIANFVASGTLNAGSIAIDSSAGLMNAQIPEGTAQSTAAPPTNPTSPPAPQALPVAPPILQIVDADNLIFRKKIQSPENLAGKSLLNAKGDMTARDSAFGSPRIHHHIFQTAHHSPARNDGQRLVERLGSHGRHQFHILMA